MRGSRRPVGILTLLIVIGMLIPAVFAAEFTREAAAKYILATAKAFRSVYTKQVVGQVSKSNVKPDENWMKDDHAVMLPAQFIKAAGAELKDFELGLIGSTSFTRANRPSPTACAGQLGADSTKLRPAERTSVAAYASRR